MDVVLQYFDGCPNWHEVERRVRQALASLDMPDSELMLQRVEMAQDAEQLSFRGSPTVLINGIDPFADPGAPVGLACRVYRTADGSGGAPTLSGLTEALAAVL